MVILQFNKLIRNKWVWGVFAIVISAAFCFDDMFTSNREEQIRGSAGTLAGEQVTQTEFDSIAEDVRGLGRNRDWKKPAHEVNLEAWEMLALEEVAKRNGIGVTDARVREVIAGDKSFMQNGQFSFELYRRLLRENSITPEHFEAFLRRQMTAQLVGQAIAGSASWVSPLEVSNAVADVTDKITVKVATFRRELDDSVKLDEAGLKKWYDENAKSLALPERVKLRMVEFSALDTNVLAKMTVTDAEAHDYYDANVDKYTTKDTNGVEHAQAYEEVKDQIVPVLKRIAAVQYFETNLNNRAYAVKAAPGASRLTEIAAEDGKKVTVSAWFATDGDYKEGFMSPISTIAPGAAALAETVAELDSDNEDLRYGVVSSDKAVWLVEKAEVSPAHTPTLAEAAAIIRPRALEQAREDAFKAQVEAVAAKGVAAVEATKDCTTNITFAIADMKAGEFVNQWAVARAARTLAKGGISDFVRISSTEGMLVVCVDRVPGDAAKVKETREEMRKQVASLAQREIPAEWQKWNLRRLGFVPGDTASVTAPSDEEAAESAE